jgi:hypothetical protein
MRKIDIDDKFGSVEVSVQVIPGRESKGKAKVGGVGGL